jgi:hypothetical protein
MEVDLHLGLGLTRTRTYDGDKGPSSTFSEVSLTHATCTRANSGYKDCNVKKHICYLLVMCFTFVIVIVIGTRSRNGTSKIPSLCKLANLTS